LANDRGLSDASGLSWCQMWHAFKSESSDEQPCVAAPVRIGSDVWIGAGVCILREVTVGDGAVIGAGAVVRHHISPYDGVARIPARIMGNRSPRVGP
jgi:acetyltransferase-like isoleucine patch superfamily enzyme